MMDRRRSGQVGQRAGHEPMIGLHPGHLQDIGRYNRALQQRNALVQKIGERRASADLLDSWDLELASAAAPIFKARASYSAELMEEFARIVAAHRYHVGDLAIRYQRGGLGEEDGPEDLIRKLRANRKRGSQSPWHR